jgi:hypothetical protein
MALLPKPVSLKSPSWRLDLCLSRSEDAVPCRYIENLKAYLKDPLEADEVVSQAYMLYYLPQSRAIMTSLLVASTDSVSIAKYIDSSEEVVIHFSKLFFDMSVFPNKLVIKEYIDSLPENNSSQKNHKSLLRAAYSLGDRYVAWKMSLTLDDELDCSDINKNLLEDSYWRSREHKPFSIDDPKAKESKSWIPQVLRTVDSITASKVGGEISLDTLRLKLVKTDSTLSKNSLDGELKG